MLDKDGNPVSPSDFAAKKWYCTFNTPGCTRQACAFASAYEYFKTMNVVVIGVSKIRQPRTSVLRKSTICRLSCSPTRS